MKLSYLLEDTVLFGGVKVVLRQADLLAARGHDVTIVSRGPRPEWYDLKASFRQVDAFNRETVPPSDVTVATFWTTLGPAVEAAHRAVAHYCQGLEFTYTHNTAEHGKIMAAYRRGIPALVVSAHLGDFLDETFDRPSRVVLQPLEDFWKPGLGRRLARRPKSPPRVLVTGPWEGDWKGVRTALEAIKQMRASGLILEVVRISQYELTGAEADVVQADEYHHHIKPEAVASVVQGCDLMLAPSWEQEGFGLPVLEAFAAGVPVVASDISAFQEFASDAATLVPARDSGVFASAARHVLSDPALWRHMRRAGFSVADRYTEERAARSAEQALEWVVSGEWKERGAKPETGNWKLET
jgi:glycosyltransferase involved in cell wall biosynthesis